MLGKRLASRWGIPSQLQHLSSQLQRSFSQNYKHLSSQNSAKIIKWHCKPHHPPWVASWTLPLRTAVSKSLLMLLVDWWLLFPQKRSNMLGKSQLALRGIPSQFCNPSVQTCKNDVTSVLWGVRVTEQTNPLISEDVYFNGLQSKRNGRLLYRKYLTRLCVQRSMQISLDELESSEAATYS